MSGVGAPLRLLAIVACVANAPAAFADALPAKQPLPRLEGHVVDAAGMLSARARDGLDAELTAFRRETQYSIVLYVARSLDGASIEDAAYEAFNTWKVGDAGKDNGILMLVAPTERTIRIETGKGAGGAVTDLQANAIIREMGPLMARGEVEMAVTIGISGLEELVRKEIATQPTARGTPSSRRSSNDRGWVTWAAIGFIGVVSLVIVLGLRRRARRRSTAATALDGGLQKVRATAAVLEVVGGVLRIIAAVAGSGRRGGGGTRRRSGGGGGRSGGGGSSGRY